jgi:hypothetical protein
MVVLQDCDWRSSSEFQSQEKGQKEADFHAEEDEFIKDSDSDNGKPNLQCQLRT